MTEGPPVLVLSILLLLPCLHPARSAGAVCPQATSIFDLPDIHSCRGALRDVQDQQAACTPGASAARCCHPALAFVAAGCHCWRGFNRAAVSRLRALAEQCPPAQDLEQRQQAAAAAGSDAGASAVAGAGHVQWAAGGAGSDGDLSSTSLRVYTGVLSASKNREARDAIRASWGAHPLLYRVRFFVARSLNDTLFDEVRREAVLHGDMVVLQLVQEAYFNITYQTLEIVRMAAADPLVTHVLKVDDDSYVRVPPLLNQLRTLPRERMFWGYIEDPGGGPHRDPGNQWYVSKEEWESEVYPPWAHGTGYVLSADLGREIAAGAAVKIQGGRWSLFKLEDISMGAWLEWVEKEGTPVNRIKEPRFNFAGCTVRDFVSHYITPPLQRCMWEAGGRCLRRCPRQRAGSHRHRLPGAQQKAQQQLGLEVAQQQEAQFQQQQAQQQQAQQQQAQQQQLQQQQAQHQQQQAQQQPQW